MATYTQRVSVSANDGYEIPATNPNLTNAYVEVGDHGGAVNTAIRFTSVDTPQGATISSASFIAKGQDTYDSGVDMYVKVGCEDVDNSAILTTDANNIDNRIANFTSACTLWNIRSISSTTVYTLDVTNSVQEVINRVGWAASNALTILITDVDCPSGEWQQLLSYDGSSASAPYLSITYASGATYSASYTANAAIEKARSGSITANAAVKQVRPASLTANAVTRQSRSGLLVADAAIKTSATTTLTTNADIKVARADSFTADAEIATTVTQIGSLAADATIKQVIPGSLTLSAAIRATTQAAILVDAVIGYAAPGTFTVDARITSIAAAVWVSPANTISITDTPVLVFTMPTPSASQYMHFKLELDTASTFATASLRTYATNRDQTNWEYYDGATWLLISACGVTSACGGNDARYTVTTPLTEGVWYRRVWVGLTS